MADTVIAAPFVGMLVAFGQALRAADLPVGSGDLLTYCAAMEPLDPTDVVDLYWAGRTTLVTRRGQIPTYDRVFRHFSLDEGDDDADPLRRTVRAKALSEATLEIPDPGPDAEQGNEEEARLGLMASDAELLRQKSFAACTPDELAALRRIMARVRLTPPRRRTRRSVRAERGPRPDLRRTVRETMRTHGEPSHLYWRQRRRRPRPLILILDVSGSMSDHSRNLLQFAYSARRAHARVEVFCFGTRLTRITRALERRRPDEAMEQAAASVFDWDGGTRIGDALTTFVREWAARGTCRGGIVVICSDGLDRGDPDVLAKAMERLARLSHRVVWINPNRVDGGPRPDTLGMAVATPYIDELVSGHDLAGLERFVERLPALG
ncbi:MAG TPA: VWA domain-containing protein, partial [Acidimicrobiales bacterium]